MAQTLLARLKGALAAKKDDFFDNEDLLDYLNAGKDSVFGAANKVELENVEKGGRQLRALDLLRKEHTETGLTFTAKGNYFVSEFAVESDFSDLLYAGIDIDGSPVALTEIAATRINQLDWGVIKPTSYRAYYHFYADTSGADPVSTFRVFTAADTASTEVQVIYINQPSLLTIDSEDLGDLPDRLINAVVMRAALLASTQEIRENATNFAEIYKLELSENLW